MPGVVLLKPNVTILRLALRGHAIPRRQLIVEPIMHSKLTETGDKAEKGARLRH